MAVVGLAANSDFNWTELSASNAGSYSMTLSFAVPAD
jgi:hypothetical protein